MAFSLLAQGGVIMCPKLSTILMSLTIFYINYNLSTFNYKYLIGLNRSYFKV